MDRDNAIIIILLIIIVLSIGAYIVVTGVGISFNKSNDVTNVTHSNHTNTSLHSSTNSTVRDTGATAPGTTDSSSSDGGSSSSSDGGSNDVIYQDTQSTSQDVASDSNVESSSASQAGQAEGTVDTTDFD